jgi:crotonobetaine/carnitine-CoA ligase
MTRLELAPHERTLPALLRHQADAFGDRPLLTIDGASWSHAEAARAAARRAGALRAAGVERGDRVAFICGNRIEALETFLACGWIGAASVPINAASMGPQIEYLLADSGAKLLVIESRFLDRLATADLSRTSLRMLWVIGEGVPTDVAGIACAPWPGAGEAVGAEPALPGDLLAILYTSGTTGPAKGVLCPHAQFYWWGVNTARILGLAPDDVLCTTLPLFHINALNTYAQAAATGCRVAFEPRFSASAFWATMRQREATVVYLLGAMVPMLLAKPAEAAEREHRVRIGLGPGVPASAAATFRDRTGVVLLEGYGSTETNFVIATTPETSGTGSMGRVQPGFHARVVDEHDVELPPDEAGELVLRADEPFAFAAGYHGLRRTRSSCTGTPTRPWPGPWPRPSCTSRSPTSRPGCGRSTCACPRRSTAS